MNRPRGLKALLNELFGIRHIPVSAPSVSPIEEHVPELAVGLDTPGPPIDAVRIPISPDAGVIGVDETAAGPLTGEGDFCVRGSVDGGMNFTGNVLVTGLVRGSVSAANISVQGGELCGDLIAREAIFLDKGSLVVGNLSADIIETAGFIKGNIRAGGRTLLRETAVLTGDIEAKSMIIEPGAALVGKVRITGFNS